MPVMLRTNFGRRMGTLVPALLLASWGLTMAALIGAGLLAHMRVQAHNSLPQLQAQLQKLRTHGDALRQNQVALPSRAALVALQQRVSNINNIVDLKGHPISNLLSRLETLLPAKAWLVSLHQQRTQGEVQLVVASRDEGQLTQFLNRLERAPDFSDTLLTKQSSGKGKSMDVVQFEIRLEEQM